MVSAENPLQEKLKQIPDRPGVYIFKDAAGKVLYVGKAVSLRKRVLSYFPATKPSAGRQSGRSLPAKIDMMVRQVSGLEWIVTGSEAEALLYEASQIKEAHPKYNVMFRDDKSYPVIKITVDEPFPRLFVGRGTHQPGQKEIGPFADASLLRQAFQAIRRIIPFRTCRTLPKRACLDYYLGLCSAPCEGKITQEVYQQNLSRVFRLIEGQKTDVLKELQEKMREAAKQHRYEEAAEYRNQIQGLVELTIRPRQFTPSEALADMQSVLQLPTLPRRIEGFDVSNIFGKQAVGSMVTFVDGIPWKDGYRRFKIQDVAGIDDYGMMREIVSRHYTNLIDDKQPLPDLVVIDGGRGHLQAALEVLESLQLKLPVIGIAKEFEELFLPQRKEPIVLPPDSRALHVLQRLRDEAHRFAIGYHRLLRWKNALLSALDKVPGIGLRRKQDLLIRFGSVEAMRQASVQELAQVRGVSTMLAQRIANSLKK